MRQGIYKDVDGVRTIDILKAIGKCYSNGWFTNTEGIRYRLFRGARNSKKSFNMIGNEPVVRMISDDVTNRIKKSIKNEDDFLIDNDETIIYGICKDCQNK